MAFLDWINNQQGTIPVFVVVLLIISELVHCTPIGDEEQNELLSQISRHRDVPEATNMLYKFMDAQMPIKERCKRYALLLTIAEGNTPYETTISHLAVLPETILDTHLRKTDIKKVSSVFMSAIDKYRVAQLDPAFLDIIECLKQDNRLTVKRFLSDPELIMIVKCYRELLNKPDAVFDMDSINFSSFNPAFHASFRLLFKESIRDGATSEDEDQPQSKRICRAGPSSGGSAELSPSGRPAQQQQQQQPAEEPPQRTEGSNSEARRQLRVKRKRDSDRRRLRTMRDEELIRRRERERLRQRRLRLLQPFELREREKERQKRRRIRQRDKVVADNLKRYKEMDEDQLQQTQENALESPPQMNRHTIDLIGQRWHHPAVPNPEAASASMPVIASSMPNQPARQRVSAFREWSSSSNQPQQQIGAQQQQRTTAPEHIAPVLSTTLPVGNESRARQTLFRPQPLVRHVAPFSCFAPERNLQVASPSPSLQIYSPYNRPLNSPADQTDFRRPANSAFHRPRYNYMSESASRDGPSPSAGSLMSTWHTFDPRARAQSNSFNDLSSFASRLDDTDAVVQSIANQTPRVPTPASSTTTRDSFFEADSMLASPWYDFDRRFSTRDD